MGAGSSLGMDDPEPTTLLKIDDNQLDIDPKRAANMAVKYLMAANHFGDKKLFNPDVVWNARKDAKRPDPKFDPESRSLVISTALTIPDSGHRHYAYYLINSWKNNRVSCSIAWRRTSSYSG